MIPPNVSGKIKSLEDAGKFRVRETVMVLEMEDFEDDIEIHLSHFWPVRSPRPVLE